MRLYRLTLPGVFLAAAWAQPAPPSGATTSVTYNATYKLDGGAASQSGQSYTATAADTSGVWVTNSGVLILTSPVIRTSGNTSSTDNSSFYGLNAALLATAAGSATVTGGSIATSGTGANGAFATGAGSSLTLNGVAINATGDGGHAVMATQGASLTLTNVTMNTAGGSASAIATDRGGGAINVTGGAIATSGSNSAGIYSTGAIAVSGATFKATGAETAVIEGANSIALTDVSLTSTFPKWGVMIYQSMSGDAAGTQGVFTMTGGSLTYTPSSGPLFYVTNSTAIITLKGVTATTGSGVFLQAAAGQWGASGSNGGAANLTADAQTLAGDIVVDGSSVLALTLKNGSSLTGAINRAASAKTAGLTLDATSQWTLTADSYLSALSDAGGISGAAVTNITGNGHRVYYDATLSANSYLAGKTYALPGGGSLLPVGSASTAAPAILAVRNAASFAAGAAPGAWISIFGSNLAASTATVTASDLVNGYLPSTFAGATVTIDGKPAYLSYASPTQINAQAPGGLAAGHASVVVTTAAGNASFTVAVQSLMPALFTSSNYVLAVRPFDSAIIDGTGAAARPGDILELYGTSLGDTSTTIAPGLVFSGAYPTTETPAVTIGGTGAAVSLLRTRRRRVVSDQRDRSPGPPGRYLARHRHAGRRVIAKHRAADREGQLITGRRAPPAGRFRRPHGPALRAATRAGPARTGRSPRAGCAPAAARRTLPAAQPKAPCAIAPPVPSMRRCSSISSAISGIAPQAGNSTCSSISK